MGFVYDEAMAPYNPGISFFAFRYALGRMTYAPTTVVAHLKANWSDISRDDKDRILLEIRQAIADDRAGMRVDVETWTQILSMEAE